jgi:hypothetical protein
MSARQGGSLKFSDLLDVRVRQRVHWGQRMIPLAPFSLVPPDWLHHYSTDRPPDGNMPHAGDDPYPGRDLFACHDGTLQGQSRRSGSARLHAVSDLRPAMPVIQCIVGSTLRVPAPAAAQQRRPAIRQAFPIDNGKGVYDVIAFRPREQRS